MRRRQQSLVLAGSILGLLLVLSGCGHHKHAPPPPPTTTTLPVTTTTPIGPPPAIKITPLTTVTAPTSMTQRKGDPTLFVTERAGQVVAIKSGAVQLPPLLDISSDVSTDGERGLLGLAFSPVNPSLMYVDYTDKNGDIHITEYTLGADGIADPHTKRDLLVIPHSSQNNHNGGQLLFGPDGDLYIGVGDGGGEGDPQKNGQNLTVLLGKILRINPQPSPNLPYTIPYDNPFVKQQGARGEIWAYGLRNPWRFSFDSNNRQDQGIWIGDVGQDHWEEVDHAGPDPRGGENYGWPLREGLAAQDGNKPTNAIDPIYVYPHSNGNCAIIGGYVYRGKAIPGLFGRYIFGDNCSGQLMSLTQVGTSWQEADLSGKVAGLDAFGVDENGELYVMALDGTIGRIDAG